MQRSLESDPRLFSYATNFSLPRGLLVIDTTNPMSASIKSFGLYCDSTPAEGEQRSAAEWQLSTLN